MHYLYRLLQEYKDKSKLKFEVTYIVIGKDGKNSLSIIVTTENKLDGRNSANSDSYD
jgi:hypothetical protein